MFAVIRAGGKQYRVVPEDVIRIDRVNAEPGKIVEFGEVLMLGGDTPQLGMPTITGAMVAGEVLQHTRGDKVIAFKKRRRAELRSVAAQHQDFAELDDLTRLALDAVDPDHVFRGNTVLFAAGSDDCEHLSVLVFVSDLGVVRTGFFQSVFCVF